MKLLLIGHSVVDFIHKDDNVKISPGGIFYSASALNSFKEKDDEIYLVTFMNKENENYFSSVYNNINTNFVVQNEIPKVHLKIFDESERCEWYENITGNISLSKIKNYNAFNGILINMITGFDISLEQLKILRQNYKGKIYFDVHTLSRGLNDSGDRIFRKIPHANEWLKNINILQVNENELFTLSDLTDEKQIADHVLNLGVECFIITKGEKGGSIYTPTNNYEFNAVKSNNKNKIGLGDTFGAVFFYSYIKFLNFELALNLAKNAAASAASYENVKDFKRLKNDTLARIN